MSRISVILLKNYAKVWNQHDLINNPRPYTCTSCTFALLRDTAALTSNTLYIIPIVTQSDARFLCDSTFLLCCGHPASMLGALAMGQHAGDSRVRRVLFCPFY